MIKNYIPLEGPITNCEESPASYEVSMHTTTAKPNHSPHLFKLGSILLIINTYYV